MQFAAPLVAATSVVLFVRSWRASIERKKRTDAILAEYRELFDTPVERLLALRDALVEQMEAGLDGKEGGLMMLPSYVDVLPSGRERGDCYAIDLGGTNLRVAHVALSEADGAVEETHIRTWEVPTEHFDLDSGGLIAFVARCTAEVVREHSSGGGSSGKPVIGFCFSFPVDQTALDNGRVLSMTKNFKGTGLLGQDVVAELRRELAAQGIDALVPAVMNDTVATLVALRYSEPDTQLGIIVGTGTNCAYAERVSDIRKLPPSFRGRTDRMVINSEWGDFNSPLLPTCDEDIWIDCSSTHPGRSLFEKQISGLFLGELARRMLLRLAEKERLFGGSSAPGLLAQHNKFSTADMAACDEDDSQDLREVAAVLERVLEIRGTTRQQRATVQEVCRLVCSRSARLTAAAIAGVLKRLGHVAGTGGSGTSIAPPPRVVIAFDGSVFSKYNKYRERLRSALEEVCGKEAADSIHLQLAQDGSLLGAAFLAVAAAEWEAASSGSSGAAA